MDADRLNLRHLRAVTAIVGAGTVSGAAREVSLTQPAITQAIAKLEAQLGLRLFERSPSGMVATQAGALLASRSARALQLIGNVRVTAPQARSFLALARHGSYAAAAEVLGTREPSLHRAVSDLGISLGQTIVERRGRGVALTRAGAALARCLRLARSELDSALAELDAFRGREVGRIAVGAMPLSRAKLLPDTLAEFHRRHPGVDLAIVEGSHAELLGPLRNGEIDLMVGALRSSVPTDLQQVPLMPDRPVVLGRAGHPLTSLEVAITPKELARFPWIVPEVGTPLRAHWTRMFDGAGSQVPRVPIECGSVLVIRQLLMTGDYLALLSPDQVAMELQAGWLTKVCAAPGDPTRTIGLTSRADWLPTQLQQSFVDLLSAQAKKSKPTQL